MQAGSELLLRRGGELHSTALVASAEGGSEFLTTVAGSTGKLLCSQETLELQRHLSCGACQLERGEIWLHRDGLREGYRCPIRLSGVAGGLDASGNGYVRQSRFRRSRQCLIFHE